MSNANIVAEHEILQQLLTKEVVKSKMLNVAGEMCFQYEKELDESNQIIKG